jgi:hypothetical protein
LAFDEYALFFDRSINLLEIEYPRLGDFPTYIWKDALKETFPGLSFFIVGEIMTEVAWGVEWKAYQDGVCISSEEHICHLDGWEDELYDQGKPRVYEKNVWICSFLYCKI